MDNKESVDTILNHLSDFDWESQNNILKMVLDKLGQHREKHIIGLEEELAYLKKVASEKIQT